MKLQKRNNIYYLRKRVPARYLPVEDRASFYVSLKTDSLALAQQKAAAIWNEQVELWEARLAGDDVEVSRRHASAQAIALSRGFRYLHAADVADLPRRELLKRIEAIPDHEGTPDKTIAAAVLGTVAAPVITVSRALELYWTLAKDKTLGKSEDQLRRWKNPRKKAIRNFLAVVGDKPLTEITGDDMLDFREWWYDGLETRGLTANSANKDFTHLGDVLKTVNRMKRLNLELPLSGLAFKEGEAKQRPPFSRLWIEEHLLRPGALTGLNDEARAILLAMINTGLRPSELAGMMPEEIRLDANMPHIALAPHGRQLKTKSSRRTIPLLGVSLEAMRAHPDGFARYRGSSASLSATINKYLRANDLLETPEHSLYGLRHSFEDRMLAAGIDERIRRDLMGHSLQRERYGDGGSLEMLSALLVPVSL